VLTDGEGREKGRWKMKGRMRTNEREEGEISDVGKKEEEAGDRERGCRD
jgi:hypothetical protein